MNHEMHCETQTPDEALFTCHMCDRRLVLNRWDARITIIDRGDIQARHYGSTSLDVDVTARVEAQR